MSKKKPTGKSSGKKEAVDENAVTRQMVLSNYGKMCRSIGMPQNTHVNDVIRGKEEDGELVNFILEGDVGPIGPGGVRALATAILGTGPNITTGPYINLRYIRFWKQDIGDEGAAAIASLLYSTPPGLNIAYLELLDCGIGKEGCTALAEALKAQKQPGLLTLNLDYNSDIGDEGAAELCQGLFTNTTLKQLHLDYCNIGPEGAIKLAQLVCLPQSALETLSIGGNNLGDEGLLHFSLGLARSHSLVTLNLFDNGIRHTPEAMTAFRDALTRAKSLAHVDFTYNPIDVEGAEMLLPALGPENIKLKSFQVDSSLPADIFARLNRAAKAEGKKKGKKKGGGKKKK